MRELTTAKGCCDGRKRYWLYLLALPVMACGDSGPVEPDGEVNPGLTLDSDAAVKDTVDLGEMTLSTTSNGIQYTLTVPAAALPAPVEITMTPVRAAGGAIGKAGLVAGVRLQPEGLIFVRAATLTIVLGTVPGTSRVFGVSAAGDGSAPHLVPVGRDGGSLNLTISHFSTAAVVSSAEAIPPPPAGAIREAAQSVIMDHLGFLGSVTSASLATIINSFASWYDSSVRVKLEAASATDGAAVVGLSELDAWTASLAVVSLHVGEPGSTQLFAAMGARINAGRQLVGAALLSAIARNNAACRAQSGNLTNALQAAANVLYWQEVADANALAGAGSDQFADLTLDAVLAGLCLRIEYASVQFAATIAIGERRAFEVRAGFSVDGGAPLFSALPDVSVQPAGAIVVSGQLLAGPTNHDGFFRTELEIQQNAVVVNVSTCGPVTARLQRICHDTLVTRNTGALFWTFDTGLDGWSVANAGREYDTAQWISNIGNPPGGIWLDGSDFSNPDGVPNGWLFRAVQLPADAITLTFDTRAQQTGQDGALRVRLVQAGGQSQILLDWEVLGGAAWVPRTVDISAYAGQAVTIFFEQSDNDVGSGEGRFIDNVRVVSSSSAP